MLGFCTNKSKLGDETTRHVARSEAAGRSELNLRALDELAYKNQELKAASELSDTFGEPGELCKWFDMLQRWLT